MSDKRPDRTTMQGMIWNANHVLDHALDPKQKGLPRALFKEAEGVILLSTVEVGFIFSGNVGTGIILAKGDDGKWSPPCACGLTGMGWGLLVGGAVRDIIVFIFDPAAMDALKGKMGLKIGGQASLTLGPIGRDYAGDIHLSGKGLGATASFAMSKGVFAGLSLEGAVVGARNAVNQTYYNKPDVTPTQILKEHAVELPEGSVTATLMPEIYKKLDQLSEGVTAEPSAAEQSKTESARQEAEQAGKEAEKYPDVEYVDHSSRSMEQEA